MNSTHRAPSRRATVPAAVAALLVSTVLSGCALGPPAAPIPDETRKVPANDRRELALMACTGELSAAQIALAEAGRAMGHALATAGELQVENARLVVAAARRAAPTGATSAPLPPASQIFVVFHRSNSAAVELAEEEAAKLVQAARSAERIEIRGRTDGTAETPAESRIARLRAEQMQDWLVRAGVPAGRIHPTWQPVGDHLEPNDSPEGRAVNRRVEVEVYAVAPIVRVPHRGPRPNASVGSHQPRPDA